MRIGVVSVQVPFVSGGAEVHAQNLIAELRLRGFEAELITIPFKWYPPQAIVDTIAITRMLDLTEANGAKIDRLIGLKFPAYLVPHPNKVLWILHQHRTAYELWDHPSFGDLINFPDGKAVREAIKFADDRFLPEAKAIYANSQTVSDRLFRFNRILAPPLYHPPGDAGSFYCAPAEDYFYFPSRITRLKRHDLVVEALSLCREPVRIIFSGASESPEYMAELESSADRLGVKQRIGWRGFVANQEKVDLYAKCLGVVYPPIDAYFGYITLEALLTGMAVFTTSDSGGPLEFVVANETGLVAEPKADALAAIMDEAWRQRQQTVDMGEAGKARYAALNISWDNVVETLTA